MEPPAEKVAKKEVRFQEEAKKADQQEVPKEVPKEKPTKLREVADDIQALLKDVNDPTLERVRQRMTTIFGERKS